MDHRPQARITIAAELAFFIRRDRLRGPGHTLGPDASTVSVTADCDGVSSLGHVVQSIGIPLTEVGALLVNGRPQGSRYRPHGGDRIEVQPVHRPQRLPEARFVLDVHLGTVARRLRLVGVDAAYDRDASDDELIAQANAERRVLLTQDRGLLCRRGLWLGGYVRGSRPDEQFADVLDRFAPPLAPWTRCTACNGLLAEVSKTEIEAGLPAGTRRTYAEFAQCHGCGRVYWRGAHSKRLEPMIEGAIRAVEAATTRRTGILDVCVSTQTSRSDGSARSS